MATEIISWPISLVSPACSSVEFALSSKAQSRSLAAFMETFVPKNLFYDIFCT